MTYALTSMRLKYCMSNQQAYLTFLVPCYNYAQYLTECVSSIQAQTFQDWELLILDDASTDDTPAIAERLANEDSRIRYYRHEQNIGHLANYNWGIQKAAGELIWLISADDCLASHSIAEEFVTQFQTNPALGFGFCRVQCIDGNSDPYDKKIPRNAYHLLPETKSQVFSGHTFFRRLIQENFVPAPSTVARKICYSESGLFRSELTHSGDWFNWLVFSLGRDVYYDPDPKVYYRKHNNNMHLTYEKPRQALENTLLCYQMVEDYLYTNDYSRQLKQALRFAKAKFMKKTCL